MATYLTYDSTPKTGEHGDKGKNSRGQTVYYDSGSGKWVTSGTWSQIVGGPTITGNGYTYTSRGAYNNTTDPDHTNPLTIEQVNAERAAKRLGEYQSMYGEKGYRIVQNGDRYFVQDPSGTNVFSTSTPSALQRYYNENLYQGPSFTGNLWDPYGDDTLGPLEGDFPDDATSATPIWTGNPDEQPPGTASPTPSMSPSMPTNPGGGTGPVGNNPFQPGTTGPGPTLPGGGTPGGGSMFDGYGPPEGVPLNPIVKQNEMVFSPYGQQASRFSDTLTYGGLPRSTGPWGVMGGYYGGFPENYANPPEGYTPPSAGNWGNNISPGGNIPSNPIPGSTLPPNPWDPSTPINFGSGESQSSGGSGATTDPKNPTTIPPTQPVGPKGPGGGRIQQSQLTPEMQALQTYYMVNGLIGTGQNQ